MEDKHGKACERNVVPRRNISKFLDVMGIYIYIFIIMELNIVMHVNGHMTVRPSYAFLPL